MLKKIEKHQWLKYLLFFSFIGVMISSIFYVLTPKSKQIPQTSFVQTNSNLSSSQFDQIFFSGEKPDLPQAFQIFKVNYLEQNAASLAQELIAQYNLQQVNQDLEIYQNNNYSLARHKGKNEYTFVRETSPDLETTITQQEALNTAQAFLNSNLHLDLRPIKKDIKFFQGVFHLEETTPDKANYISIPYSYQLNSYPVLLANKNDYPFTIMISPDLKIQKFVFENLIADFSQIYTQKPLSIDRALANINDHNQGSIISYYLDQQIPQELSLAQIKAGELNSVKIEYRVDPELQIAYPFYRFSGKLTNQEDIDINAQIITPAIELKSN